MFYTFLMNVALVVLIVICVMYASKHNTLEEMLITMQSDLQRLSTDIKSYACSDEHNNPSVQSYKSKSTSAKVSKSKKK